MSLSATLFGTDSAIYKATNIMGLGVPGLLNKWFGTKDPEPTTQRIGEMASQTAKEGGARPIVWGRVRPISGNMMHVSAPRIVKVEVEGESSGGGKGGGKKKAPKQYQERVYRTYAIRICEGPITAVIRVWRNNKLVYDARGNSWGATNNGVFLRTFRFHLGGWAQMPDPALEGIWGAGNVPGYRGTCYMVAVDEDLTETGGAVPQYIFEVERAEGTYLTSRPYAVEDTDAAIGGISVQRLRDPFLRTEGIDEALGDISVQSMSVRTLLQTYSLGESVDGSVMPIAMSFRQAKKTVTLDAESVDGEVSVQGMIVRIGKIVYTDPAWPEACDGNISVQGMSHGTN